MKKTLLLLICGIILLPLWSCSNETDNVFYEQNSEAEIAPLIDISVVMHYLQFLTENGYNAAVVPQTADELLLHKSVFAAAAGRWMSTTLQPEMLNLYGSVYHSWRVHNLIKYGNATRSGEDNPAGIVPDYELDLQNIIEESFGVAYFIEYLLNLGDAVFHTTGQFTQLGIVIDVMDQAYNLTDNEKSLMMMEMMSVENTLRPIWQMNDFTVTNGFVELKKLYSDREIHDALDLLALLTEISLANSEHLFVEQLEFIWQLADHSNKHPVTSTYSEDILDRTIRAFVDASVENICWYGLINDKL